MTPSEHADLNVLERLFKGDRSLVREWISTYLEEAPPQFERLQASVIANDAAGLIAFAHDLRPQAHYLGATRLLEQLIAMDQRARNEGASACAEQLHELMAISKQVEHELRLALTDP